MKVGRTPLPPEQIGLIKDIMEIQNPTMQVCPYLPCGPIVSTFCPSSSARWTQGGGRCGLEWIKVEAGGHNCQGQIEAAPFLI